MIRRVDGYNRVTVVTIFIARHHIALFEIILRRDALASYRDVTGEVAEHLATLGHFIVHAVLFNVNQPLGGSAIRYSTCPPHNSAGIGLTQETMELLRPFQATGHGSIITFRRIADFGQPHGNSLRFGFAEQFNGRIFPGHRIHIAMSGGNDGKVGDFRIQVQNVAHIIFTAHDKAQNGRPLGILAKDNPGFGMGLSQLGT